MQCTICGCEHPEDLMHRTGLLNLRGSEDDYICNRCKVEIAKFARTLQCVSDKVRFAEIEKNKQR